MSTTRTVKPEHQLTDAKNDAEAAQLRSTGFSYREIAAHQGCSLAAAHTRVQRALKAVPAEAVEALRMVESDRLDSMWKIAWREALRDHLTVSHGKVVHHEVLVDGAKQSRPVIDHGAKLHAIEKLVRIAERRARLFGLDAPSRARVEVITEDAIDAEIRRLQAELAESDEPVPAE